MTPDPDAYCTAINCSVGRPPGDPDLDRATALGIDRVELWWPWTTPEPTDAQVDDLVEELTRRELTLVALNFWGGDLDVGERGVLHREPLSRRHLDAHARLAGRTGAELFNLLLGRDGRTVTDTQRERVAAVAGSVTGRHLGTVLIEPSRSPEPGPTDYPVQTIAEAYGIIDGIPGTGLLADLWHLAGTVGEEGVTSWLQDLRWNGRLPAHVQLADDPCRGAPETGVLPLDTWLRDLEAVGYTGEVAGEWMW